MLSAGMAGVGVVGVVANVIGRIVNTLTGDSGVEVCWVSELGATQRLSPFWGAVGAFAGRLSLWLLLVPPTLEAS